MDRNAKGTAMSPTTPARFESFFSENIRLLTDYEHTSILSEKVVGEES
jgi:hypothetical protein